jgi:hypothetical protein
MTAGARRSETGIQSRSDIRGGGEPPLAIPRQRSIPEAKRSTQLHRRYSYLWARVSRSRLRIDRCNARLLSGTGCHPDKWRLHENPRGTVDGAGACDRPGLRQVLELKRPSGERNRLGISLTLLLLAPGTEGQFYNPRRFCGSGLKFPLARTKVDSCKQGRRHCCNEPMLRPNPPKEDSPVTLSAKPRTGKFLK